MAYTKGLAEIIEEVRKTKNVKIKANILRENQSTQLIDLFQLTYNPTIKWILPEGNPPYDPAPKDSDLEGALLGKMRMMKYFISVNDQVLEPNVHPIKRESIFVQLLEGIDPADARLVLEMKAGDIKGVSKTVVKEAFPQIQTEEETNG
jgi:methyl coenzyme M reductase gamma subunit